MRVLVTGGRGFLGRVLTLVLLDYGHQVVVLGRSDSDLPDGAESLRVDLRDRAATIAALSAGDVEAACHLAALTNVRESFADPLAYFDTNVTGTLNLLLGLAARPDEAPRPRFVLASTSAVYGSGRDGKLDEGMDPRPENPYAASKLAAEQLVGYHAGTGAIGAISLRCFNIAGAYRGVTDPNQTRIINAALRAAAGEIDHVTINGDGSAMREFTHVRDVAEAFQLAIEHATPGTSRVMNVGTGDGVSMNEVIRVAQKVTEREIAVVHGPAAHEAQTLVAANSAVRSALGWSPTWSHVEQVIRDAWREQLVR